MPRHYYSNTISGFLEQTVERILGILANNNEFSLEINQRTAWNEEIRLLKNILTTYNGNIFFEFSIPRMGRRIDVVLFIENFVFVLEFKVGEKEFTRFAIDQVWDYAIDLKNFHETSHELVIVPILIATEAKHPFYTSIFKSHLDKTFEPICTNSNGLKTIIDKILMFYKEDSILMDGNLWSDGRYAPTPTILEAATALYNNHSVTDISRSDASAKNLSDTTQALANIISTSRIHKKKAICFVTGVPGAGKTLVGLDIATKHMNSEHKTSSVFLSGNDPLVNVLCEALTRDRLYRIKEKGGKAKKIEVMSEVKAFIQKVHHYRDAYLDDETAPFDHIAIFDEAQRAWDLENTRNFMARKKGRKDFNLSEPEFLIQCLDRHPDWAVIICLVGGGQEINTGEAGISEWLEAINRSFPHWEIHVSSNLTDREYAAGEALSLVLKHQKLSFNDDLHLSVSMRSFRAENVSLFVKHLLDLQPDMASEIYNELRCNYPLALTRNLDTAKKWLKEKARGNERYGIVVSSQAQRLKPLAIDVRYSINPIHWFLNEKEDTRSSYYLEDVATEFQVQGLELDWACLTWDGDFRYTTKGWQHFSFTGNKWQNINKAERKTYLKNAYRVLLTRARQGMVIVVPEGNSEDPTRKKEFYDGTYNYLKGIGIEVI